jgi:RNA polymerase sigma-70 factor (ECF subfamily)
MLKRFLVNEYDRAHTARRGGGQVVIDLAAAEQWLEAEAGSGETPEKMFERHWALAVLDSALGALRDEAAEAGKVRQFEVLGPFLSREPVAGDYETAGAALGINTRAVAVAVHRLRHRYRDLLRAELAAGHLDRTRVDDEMRHLFAALE